MACSICGAEADIVLLRRGPSGAAEESLCQDCAGEKGLRARGGSIAIDFEALLGRAVPASSGLSSCPDCGHDIDSLRRTGRIGCLRCIDVFRDEIRDRLSRRRPAAFPRDGVERKVGAGALRLPSFLQGRLRIGRVWPGIPLSGPKNPHPAREQALSLLPKAGFGLRRLGELRTEEWSRLVVAASPPPFWLADSESLVGFKDGTSLVCLVDCDDHLSLRISAADPELSRYEGELLAAQREIDSLIDPVRDQEFGFVSRSFWDFGAGLTGEILMHLPALEMGGALDQVLRAALSEGWSLEGRSGSDHGSAGALWLLKAGEELEAPPEALAGTALRLAAMEASTLKELVARAGEELLDRGGRAYGLITKARSLSVGESLEALSDLRLAVLGGYVPGFSADRLGELLLLGHSPGAGRQDASTPIANTRLPGLEARERANRLRSSLGLDEPFAMPGPFLKTQGGW